MCAALATPRRNLQSEGCLEFQDEVEFRGYKHGDVNSEHDVNNEHGIGRDGR
jgi:hypothetical protein